ARTTPRPPSARDSRTHRHTRLRRGAGFRALRRSFDRNPFSGSGEQFQHVAVGIFEVHATSAAPLVDLHVILRERSAPVWDARVLDAREDSVELGIADVKRVVVHVEVVPVVEVEGQSLIDPDRREVTHRTFVLEPEDMREEVCRRDLVARGYDRVIERDSHMRTSIDRSWRSHFCRTVLSAAPQAMTWS